jgi:chemotaxis protein methyltransferase CheR
MIIEFYQLSSSITLNFRCSVKFMNTDSMKARTFNEFRTFIYERSGISLGEKKEALVAARVGKRTRALGLQTSEEYLDYVKNDSKGEELIHLLDAISTNVTHFFREPDHFDFITKCFLTWYGEGQRKFKCWSAGCSSGEEPYSLGITLLEALGNAPVPDLRILATDLSTKVLAIAQNGMYEKSKTQGISTHILDTYFKLNTETSIMQVTPELRSLITFSRLNLSHHPFPMSGPMDIIMCRNVMIYFDQNFRKRLVTEYHRLLRNGGYLFVGHAESLTGLTNGFKSIAPSVYIKV